MTNLIAQIASDEIIDQAYQWLCQSREHYHYNADVWHLRRWWFQKLPLLQNQLLAGQFRFRELRLIRGRERTIEWWSSLDALVCKAISLVLSAYLRPHLSQRCFHLAENGGLKGAVREVAAHLRNHNFVFRTDVKAYYASINHDILFRLLSEYVHDEMVLDLLWQYLKRCVADNCLYTSIQQGISLGCPLSPLMGALFLKPLDDRMAPLLGVVEGELGCFYVRYMDDWVVLAPTRWKLRAAIKAVNEVMEELLVEKHPDKTFIGRISRGFDFLGYRFFPDGLSVALQTVERCMAKVVRLYEQGASVVRIGLYLRRWWQWVRGGVLFVMPIYPLPASKSFVLPPFPSSVLFGFLRCILNNKVRNN
ncbi:MAG: reverse transcriptase [Symploca sp. SIO2E9]|nr:reverse transcriptase [Symploca sp. SIO2E9]